MLTQHPLSAAFPAMADADFAALVDDIAANGLRHPVVLYQGQVIDGWHRYSACLKAGIEPEVTPLDDDVDPRAFVLSLNLSRRHLTASQRAVAVVAVAEWKPKGANQFSGGSAPGADALAEQAKVSVRTVEHAKAAVRAGRAQDVRDGKVSVKAAAEEARGSRPPRPTTPAEPEQDESADDRLDDIVADYEALLRVVEADDKLEAMHAELRAAQAKHAELQRLYEAQRVELANMTKEARRWMRKAQTLEKAAKS